MKTLVIDLRYPREHAHAFPLKGTIHAEVDVHTPTKSLEPCTTSIVLHQLRTIGAVTQGTNLTHISFQRVPSPTEYFVATIYLKDVE